jgi:hypothetical protein
MKEIWNMEVGGSIIKQRAAWSKIIYPNSYPFQIYETDPGFGASYPQQKQAIYMAPKWRYEQFEITPFVEEVISEYQERAKNMPNSLMDNNKILLIYWPEDRVFYYCTARSYNKFTDKFDLYYEDGVEEAVQLWDESFLTLDKFNMIKHKLEPPKAGYERAPFNANDYPPNYWYQPSYDTKMKNGNHQEIYGESEKKITKRSVSKDTNNNTKQIKLPVKVQIDEFTIIAKECSPSDWESSLSGEQSYEEYQEKIQYDKSPKFENDDKKKNKFALDESSNFIIKTGPFDTVKIPNSKNENVNEAILTEKKECEQIYTPRLFNFLFGKNHSNWYEEFNGRMKDQYNQRSNDRAYPTTRSALNDVNGDWTMAWRQKHLLPSAQRIRRDMKVFEKKFYERYLSNGYKLWDWPVCLNMELKFLIKEDRDPMDFKHLHEKYLQKKLRKEKISRKGGIYQNHTIIFLNKAGI